MSEGKMGLVEELKRMGLDWFGGDEPDEMRFEEGDQEEEEVVVLRAGEQEPQPEVEPPLDTEKEELRRKIAELSERSSANSSPADIAGAIASAINKERGGEEPRVEQQPGESDADFAKRLEVEMFKPGGTYKAIQEAVFRIIGPAWNQTMGATVQQSKSLMELHPEKGPLFKKYAGEIEERRKRLPYPQRNSLDVYERLFRDVVADHAGEIDQERVQDEVKKQVAAALKEYGIDPEKGSKPTFVEGAGQRGASAPTKKRVYITEEDAREAKIKGMDPRDYVRYRYGR